MKGKKDYVKIVKKECLAALYCEHCIRNYLKAKFSNWTSGNDDINNLIRKCQMETLGPYLIVEWIPYNSLKNIKYLTKGVYSAEWIGGRYDKWDIKEKILKRLGTHDVILKKLEKVENVNRSWFDEVCKCNLKNIYKMIDYIFTFIIKN